MVGRLKWSTSLAAFAQRLPHPIYLIPPSIDPLTDKNIELEKSEIEQVFPRFDLDPERPIMLQVSRFDRFKDPLGVIQAYRLTKKFYPHLQLVLAGRQDWGYRQLLTELAQRGWNEGVVQTGFVIGDDLPLLYEGARVLALPSLHEGFGLPVLEAMACGTPGLTADAASLPEVAGAA